MPGGNVCLLDSNILLRLSESDDPLRPCRDQPCASRAGRPGVWLCYTRRRLGSAARKISRLSKKTKMTSAFGYASMPDPPVPCKMEPSRPPLPE